MPTTCNHAEQIPWVLNTHVFSVGDRCYILQRNAMLREDNPDFGFTLSSNLEVSICVHGEVVSIPDEKSVEVEYTAPMPAESRKGGYRQIRDVVPLTDAYPFTHYGRRMVEDRFRKRWGTSLCHACPYFPREDQGWEPDCKSCKHKQPRYKKYGENAVLHDFTCNKSGLNLRVAENDRPKGGEFCRYYEPCLPQYEPIWISYSSWLEHLRACTHNPDCVFHRYSAWKTEPFGKWLNGTYRMFVHATYKGRPVEEIAFPRIHHLNMDFYLGDNKIMANKVRYKPELTKNGLLKKGFTYQDWDDCPEGFVVLYDVEGDPSVILSDERTEVQKESSGQAAPGQS